MAQGNWNPHTGLVTSSAQFEAAATRRALEEQRADENRRNAHLMQTHDTISFHVKRGMSRGMLVRIYGRDAVDTVLAAMAAGTETTACRSA